MTLKTSPLQPPIARLTPHTHIHNLQMPRPLPTRIQSVAARLMPVIGMPVQCFGDVFLDPVFALGRGAFAGRVVGDVDLVLFPGDSFDERGGCFFFVR